MNTRSKIEEIGYAKQAFQLLKQEWEVVEDGVLYEAPDLKITDGKRCWGLEVTHEAVDRRGRKESRLMKQEGENRKALIEISNNYYIHGGSPIELEILGIRSVKKYTEEITNVLLKRKPKRPLTKTEYSIQDRIGGMKLIVRDLPEEFKGYSIWTNISDCVGYVGKINCVDIQATVDKKSKKVEGNMKSFDFIDLLIVYNRTRPSGMANYTDCKINKAKFSRVFVMIHPFSVHEL